MNNTKNNTLMSSPDKRLSIMSDLEEFAFYGFPDFDDQQRLNYFVFTPDEWEVILQGSSMEAQVYAAIQMGYFKAKHIFFRFSFHKVPQDDLRFILTHCFTNQTLQAFKITIGLSKTPSSAGTIYIYHKNWKE